VNERERFWGFVMTLFDMLTVYLVYRDHGRIRQLEQEIEYVEAVQWAEQRRQANGY
jgi:hypothetical protein